MLKNLLSKLRYKTFVLIVVITCFLNCALATEMARSQDLNKRISINVEKKTLKETLDQISKQVHVGIIYSNAKGILKNPVTIHAKDQPVSKVLTDLLSPLTLTYEIIGDQIVVKFDNTSSRPPSPDQKEKQQFPIKGKVTDGKGSPLPGATIKIKDGSVLTTTDSNGQFEVKNVVDSIVLQISFVGYLTKEIVVKNANYLTISLESGSNELKEVSVVSTGYQNIPKERATGSFVQIDKDLISRRVSTNILDRLDGVASGLLFNKNINTLSNTPTIAVRGRSTIFANPNPFIILDNFPYDGDLGNINPNDIESITILKDAAAASIWGVRAANGVIVVTTKKGKAGTKVNVNFNASTNVTNKPDLFYRPQLSSADYIGMEQFLFNKGYYNSTISNGYSTITPAVAIMLQRRNGQISSADSTTAINQLKNQDVRNDLEKYNYRKAISQQYALSLDGGNKAHTYYLSVGYDNNLQNIVADSYQRITINSQNKFSLLNDRLQINTGILLTTSKTSANTQAYTNPYTPYDQIIDGNGNHLAVVQAGGLRKQYTDTAGRGALLDWKYRPLDENYTNQTTKLTDYKLNIGAIYQIMPSLNIAVNYQYERGISDAEQLNSSDSYYTRNLINSFTQLNQTTLAATRPFPLGGILYSSGSDYAAHYGRVQLNFSHKFGESHDLNVIAGSEIKNNNANSFATQLYGYQSSDASSVPVDYLTTYPLYYGSGTSLIGNTDGRAFSVDRFLSYYTNASYSYQGKYTLSASARRDESNIFGVSANQKSVPLWSTGFLWNISKEGFYNLNLLPILKLRASYGYNGNVDRDISAYLTAQNLGRVNSWNAPYSAIINPPNPSLQWERIRNINFGLDFGTSSGLFTGTIEYYIKQGLNLIGNSPIAPQTGVTQFTGNAADTKTSGFDVVVNKNIIGNGRFHWQSNLLFSFNKELITDYKVKQGSNLNIVNSNYLNPLQGYPYNALFSFKFMGLDKDGKPQGLLNGAVNENYSAIINSTDASQLVFNGSATPMIYGSLRNTFSYSNFDLSINIVYKFDYFFRRTGVFSGSNYGYQLADYDTRWQKPGDENYTNIPALTYPANSALDAFFQGSTALIEKADNIRLQDIRLSYHLKSSKTFFNQMQIYVYGNNLGLLWKATKQSLDPDYVSSAYVNPKSIAIGISTHF